VNVASPLVLVLFVAALVSLTLARRIPVRGRVAAPLRLLFPSWRFFEAEDVAYLLELRVKTPHGEAPTFVPAIPAAERGVRALLYAPQHNLRLACHDLVERWVDELSELGPVAQARAETLPSYALVKHAVAYFLRAHPAQLEGGLEMQLRLSSRAPGAEPEVLFTSPYYPVA
jgi:hypothetical protein